MKHTLILTNTAIMSQYKEIIQQAAIQNKRQKRNEIISVMLNVLFLGSQREKCTQNKKLKIISAGKGGLRGFFFLQYFLIKSVYRQLSNYQCLPKAVYGQNVVLNWTLFQLHMKMGFLSIVQL